MPIFYPDTIQSNNSNAYGIVKSTEVIGHKQVQSISDLYTLPDTILSISGNNSNNDAIGQLWYVVDQSQHYQLVDWNNRKQASGWSEYPVINKEQIGLGNVDNTSDVNKPVSTAQQQAINNAKQEVGNYTINGQKISTNPTLDKTNIGLGNVDNTSDLDKPISTATQTALDDKQDTLVSGVNIKTINGNNITGEGNLELEDILFLYFDQLLAGTPGTQDFTDRNIDATYQEIRNAIEDDKICLLGETKPNRRLIPEMQQIKSNEIILIAKTEILQYEIHISQGTGDTVNVQVITTPIVMWDDSDQYRIDRSQLPIATTTETGIVKAGDGLSVDTSGTLTLNSTKLNNLPDIQKYEYIPIVGFDYIDNLTYENTVSPGQSIYQVSSGVDLENKPIIVGTLLVSFDGETSVQIFTGIVNDMRYPSDDRGDYHVWKRIGSNGVWQNWEEQVEKFQVLDISNFNPSSSNNYLNNYNPGIYNIIIYRNGKRYYPTSMQNNGVSTFITYYDEFFSKWQLMITDSQQYVIAEVTDITAEEVSQDWYDSNPHDATTLYIITS